MRRLSLYLAIVLVSSLGLATTGDAVEFAPAAVYSVGTNPQGIVIADFNGDGKPDIAVANSGSNNVSILLANDDGTFQPAENFDAGNSPSTILIGDFNGDSKLDLALFQAGDSDHGLSGSVSILLGNGDGTFRPPRNTALSQLSAVIVAGDFNTDKKADLIVGEIERNPNTALLNLTLSFLPGNGDGTFQASRALSNFPNGRTHALLATDLNGDGKPDVAVSNGSAISILIGKGDGTFLPGTTLVLADGFTPNSILTGDLNHDGSQDLVVESSSSFHSADNEGPSSLTTHISMFQGNSNGTFQRERLVATGGYGKANVFAPASGDFVKQAILGEFNGDGKLDLAYRRIAPGLFHIPSFPDRTSLEILLGRGDGTFAPALVMSDPGSGPVAGNFKADKLSDLVALGSTNDIQVLLNTSPTAGADLGLIQASASPEPVGVGTKLAYTATVINEGPEDATGAKFTDTLPNGVDFVSATATRGSCTQSHGAVTCSVGSLASAFDSQVTIVVTPTATGTISNPMSVTATESDLATANNAAIVNSTVGAVYTLTVAIAGDGAGSVTSTPVGIDCASTGGTCALHSVVTGTSFVLTSVPSGNSTFAGWTGACNGPSDPSQCIVIMNSNQAIAAKFSLSPDFTLSPSATSLRLDRGGRVSESLTFATRGDFSGTISLTCSVSGPAPMPSCGVAPAAVTPGSNATLTVSAPGLSAALLPLPGHASSRAAGVLCVALGFSSLVMLVRLKKEHCRLAWAAGLLAAVAILPAACGGGSPTSTTAPQVQSYSVRVTATSGALQHSTTVSVTVN